MTKIQWRELRRCQGLCSRERLQRLEYGEDDSRNERRVRGGGVLEDGVGGVLAGVLLKRISDLRCEGEDVNEQASLTVDQWKADIQECIEHVWTLGDINADDGEGVEAVSNKFEAPSTDHEKFAWGWSVQVEDGGDKSPESVYKRDGYLVLLDD